MRIACLIAAIAACATACTTASDADRPDLAPLACATASTITTYRVDAVAIPKSFAEATADGFALDSTMLIDNQLGNVLEVVVNQFGSAYQPAATTDATLARSVDWVIEVETCPGTGESRVGVHQAGDFAVRASGTLVGSHLTASEGCGEAPVGTIAGDGSSADAGWVEADQVSVELEVSDAGLSGTIGWALDGPTTSDAFAVGIAPFLNAEMKLPSGSEAKIFDTNGDGVITPAEIEGTSLYQSLLAPDILPTDRLDDGPLCTGATGWLSLGLGIHATPE